MKLVIEIKCDNDAFAEDPAFEASRILNELSIKIAAEGLNSVILRDINGNMVGTAEFK